MQSYGKPLGTRPDLGLGPRLSLPADIERQMNCWRRGLADMPQSYIDWHRERAEEALRALCALYPRLRPVDRTMRDGGWFDGMRELHVIVETPSGQAVKLVYNDSNQGFMVALKSGGQGALFERDIA